MKLNKAEQQILDEISAKGYTSIEHGRGFRRGIEYGTRRVNARNTLVEKGLIVVTHRGKETDSELGHTSFHYWPRVELAKSEIF